MTATIADASTVQLNGQALLNDVVQRFTELLLAAGASLAMIRQATSTALVNSVETKSDTTFTELGSMLRDCMEVMCAWRRDPGLVDNQGEPVALQPDEGLQSLAFLCRRAGCQHRSQDILKALLDFGAVEFDVNNKIVSKTPTFLLTYAQAGGRLATDGLLKQVDGFLRVLHRNVLSVSGRDNARFERSCTVSIARELEPVFNRLIRTRGQEFIDSIDEWLERHARENSPSGRYVELGAGAYHIDLGARMGDSLSPSPS